MSLTKMKKKEASLAERKAMSVGDKPMSFTVAEMQEAIAGSGGFVTEVARRLGCSRSTVYRYKKSYREISEAIFEEKEHLLDTAESALLKQIGKGNITAIIFYLKTQGYGRAYGDRSKLDIDGNFITKEARKDDEKKDAEYVKKVMAELDRLKAGSLEAVASPEKAILAGSRDSA